MLAVARHTSGDELYTSYSLKMTVTWTVRGESFLPLGFLLPSGLATAVMSDMYISVCDADSTVGIYRNRSKDRDRERESGLKESNQSRWTLKK